MPAERGFAIAQVTPYPWEQQHEVNRYVRRLSGELARRGHRVAIVAPSSSRTLIREGRARVRALHSDAEAILNEDGSPAVIGVGQSLPFRRGRSVALPLDVSRTLEDLLDGAALDFVHVHEPFAPSAASAALRHSRALNVGTFHSSAERFVSTQVARPLVDRLFGRIDGRTAAFGATREVVERFFPGSYDVIRPGADAIERAAQPDGPAEILFTAGEERGALRVFLRALRKLGLEHEWNATIWRDDPAAAPPPQISKRLRERVRFTGPAEGSEAEQLARASIVVAASAGAAPAPGILLRALAAGAVPVAARLAQYEEVLQEGELGPLFEPRDAITLAGQLERLIGDPQLAAGYRERIAAIAPELAWERTATEFERLYVRLAARRHALDGNPAARERIARRDYIDVDLHMHTDHSHDCATPATTLLDAAAAAGLGAIAVTDHNEVSGAHEARELARAQGSPVKVIVAEEVKTADQGEVIGLFIEDKIARGMTLRETIDAIRAQGGVVYVPHPFDRMHSVPDYEHLLGVVEDVDALEVFNPRVAFSAFNEEAERFAQKYRIVAGAGSDSHVAAGLGSVKIRMRDFDGPEEFLESLRDADIVRRRTSLLYVQALKFIQTKATPANARRRTGRPGAGAKRAGAGSAEGGSG